MILQQLRNQILRKVFFKSSILKNCTIKWKLQVTFSCLRSFGADGAEWWAFRRCQLAGSLWRPSFIAPNCPGVATPQRARSESQKHSHTLTSIKHINWEYKNKFIIVNDAFKAWLMFLFTHSSDFRVQKPDKIQLKWWDETVAQRDKEILIFYNKQMIRTAECWLFLTQMQTPSPDNRGMFCADAAF